MPYFYASSRQRTLRGMGADPLPDMPLPPELQAPPTWVALPPPPMPSTAPSAPIIVPKSPGTIVAAPDIGLPSFLQQPLAKVLLPSGSPAPPPQPQAQIPAALAPGGWMDQSMIAGVPNKYLVYGGVGLVLLKAFSGKKGRR